MSLYKRGRVWWFSLNYRGKRIRQSTETQDKKLARRIRDKTKGQMVEGSWFNKLPDRTFKEMAERFLNENAPERSKVTYQSYIKSLSHFFGDHFISDITPSLVNQLKTQLKAKGQKPASINMHLKILKIMLNIAVKEWEWIGKNPIASISLLGEANKRDRWLTVEEESRILSFSEPWMKEVITFALHTGMRRSEILNLSWKEVDLFKKIVLISQSKNNEKRIIPMNQTVFVMVKEKAKVRSISDDRVFPFKKHPVQYAFEKACQRAGVENIHFHDLRHSFATRLVQAGVDLYRVQKLLGHKSPAMTQRYSHHCPESLRGSVEALVTNQSQLASSNTVSS